MTNNSTLLLVIDEPYGDSELINIDELFDLNGKYSKELDAIFSLIDYSIPDEVINRILDYTNQR